MKKAITIILSFFVLMGLSAGIALATQTNENYTLGTYDVPIIKTYRLIDDNVSGVSGFPTLEVICPSDMRAISGGGNVFESAGIQVIPLAASYPTIGANGPQGWRIVGYRSTYLGSFSGIKMDAYVTCIKES